MSVGSVNSRKIDLVGYREVKYSEVPRERRDRVLV